MSDNIENFKREFEIRKTQEQHNLEVWKTQVLHGIAIFQSVNMQGQGAMKAALFINGGASVALLAFVGTTMGKDMKGTLLLTLCFSMLLFVIGTLLAAIASGVAYLAGLVQNVGDNERRSTKLLFWFCNLLAIFMIIASYVLFFIGSLYAYFAFVDTCKM